MKRHPNENTVYYFVMQEQIRLRDRYEYPLIVHDIQHSLCYYVREKVEHN